MFSRRTICGELTPSEWTVWFNDSPWQEYRGETIRKALESILAAMQPPLELLDLWNGLRKFSAVDGRFELMFVFGEPAAVGVNGGLAAQPNY